MSADHSSSCSGCETPANTGLLAEEWDAGSIIELITLEQFVRRLPTKVATWVQRHRPTTLERAIELADDHVAAGSGLDDVVLTSSLSPSLL